MWSCYKLYINELYRTCRLHLWRYAFCLQPSCFEKFPSWYHSPLSEKLKAFVRSPKFGYIISFILIVNLFAVIIETTVWSEIEDIFKCYSDHFIVASFWTLYIELNYEAFLIINAVWLAAWYRKQLWSESVARGGVCLW